MCGTRSACSAGQRCSGGQCICDATSCPNGCCTAGGTCAAGTSETQCGGGGAACQSCGTCTVCSYNTITDTCDLNCHTGNKSCTSQVCTCPSDC
jgi:hypothetical protein